MQSLYATIGQSEDLYMAWMGANEHYVWDIVCGGLISFSGLAVVRHMQLKINIREMAAVHRS